MKKTILYSAISIALYGASIANAQEVIPVSESEIKQYQNENNSSIQPITDSTFEPSQSTKSNSNNEIDSNTNAQTNNPYVD
jgi:lipopolysaccharide export LptBFGC system permease protein LptF